jgi:NTP pyrophosphatase (non-canonical NTP hydrolase)
MIVKEEILDAVVQKWGVDAQIGILHEEIGELQSALNKFNRGRALRDDVCEEIADCLMMLQQMRRIFGQASVDKYVKIKTERLEERIADPERTIL